MQFVFMLQSRKNVNYQVTIILCNIFLCQDFKNSFGYKNSQIPRNFACLKKLISLLTRNDYVIISVQKAEYRLWSVKCSERSSRWINKGHFTAKLAATAQAGFSFFPLSLFLCQPAIPPQGAVDVVIASCHSSVEVDDAWLAAWHHERPHYWPLPPLGARLFSPLLCANISHLLRSLFSVFDSGSTLGKCTDAPGWKSESLWEEPVRDWQWLTQHAPVSCKLSFRCVAHSLRLCFFRLCPCRSFRKEAPGCEDDCFERQMLWCKHIIVVKERLAQWRFKGRGCAFILLLPPPPLQFWFYSVDVNKSIDWRFVPVYLNWTFFLLLSLSFFFNQHQLSFFLIKSGFKVYICVML